MVANIFGWFVLAGLTIVFGWLAARAWRARNAFIKWGGVILSGLVTVLLALASVAGLVGLFKAYAPRGNPVQNITVAGTPEQVERGKHLAYIFCSGCHSATNSLPLTGGVEIGKDIPIPVGSLVSVNLTPAGPLKDWSDGEIFRVLREGVDRNRRLLLVMSTVQVRHMSDEDLQSVIAYLRSQPAVENPTQQPPDRPNLLAIIMFGAGLFPMQPAVTGPIVAPPKGPTAEYGQYVVSYFDCVLCHGADLAGGSGLLTPHGPNVRVAQGWTLDQFVATMRTGVDPSGHALDPNQMPWKLVGRLDDEELAALFAYLQTLPPAQP